jgi:hypothetical protein
MAIVRVCAAHAVARAHRPLVHALFLSLSLAQNGVTHVAVGSSGATFREKLANLQSWADSEKGCDAVVKCGCGGWMATITFAAHVSVELTRSQGKESPWAFSLKTWAGWVIATTTKSHEFASSCRPLQPCRSSHCISCACPHVRTVKEAHGA